MGAFNEELRQWGPENSDRPTLSLPEAEAYCRKLATSHYENFPVLSWILPRSLRQPFANLYAWCRWADDLADEIDGTQQSLEHLQWWRRQLADCYSGSAKHPVLVALQPTIEQFGLAQHSFEDLISAFEQDQRVHAYESFTQLEDYCSRSANPVGRLVLRICGHDDAALFAWSDSICTGLQLTNFWQDVARDAGAGRTYLPRQDCEQFGYSLADLNDRVTNQPFVDMMSFQVARARKYLLAGLPLVERMSGRKRIVIELFARGGLRILDRIESIGYRVWESRPVLTKRDAIVMSGRCVMSSLFRYPGWGRSEMVRMTEGQQPSP